MNRPPEVLSAGVCFVTDGAATAGRPLLEVVQAAVAGGADLVQLREKDRPGGALLDLAKGVVAICRQSGGRCRAIVNDRLDVALAAKAAGIHLPAAGLPVAGVAAIRAIAAAPDPAGAVRALRAALARSPVSL